MTDSILVVGSGIAGLTAAIRCAESGANVVVVERDAFVGGRLAAAMTSRSSVGDSLDGVRIPKIDALETNDNIEFLTLADVEAIKGRPGSFDVSIRERARFVTDACTRCNHCRPVCPVTRPNEHDAGLSYRKAIHVPFPETLPQEFVIDIDACLNTPPNYLPCSHCIDVCDDDAIHFDVLSDQAHERHVGAVIVATGLQEMRTDGTDNPFFGGHPDIVTAAEMERLLTAPGPTGGFAAKPSNEEYAKSVLFILDELEPYPEHAACDQISRLRAQDVRDVALLVTSQPGDDDLERLKQALPAGVAINAGLLQKVEAGDDEQISVTFAEFSGSRVPEEQYDIVVLVSAARPAHDLRGLAEDLEVDLADTGFIARPDAEVPVATSREGIYVAGCAGGPAILGETAQQAELAASAALSHLDPRLLREDGEIVADDVGESPATATSEADLRARFERALSALLESQN